MYVRWLVWVNDFREAHSSSRTKTIIGTFQRPNQWRGEPINSERILANQIGMLLKREDLNLLVMPPSRVTEVALRAPTAECGAFVQTPAGSK